MTLDNKNPHSTITIKEHYEILDKETEKLKSEFKKNAQKLQKTLNSRQNWATLWTAIRTPLGDYLGSDWKITGDYFIEQSSRIYIWEHMGQFGYELNILFLGAIGYFGTKILGSSIWNLTKAHIKNEPYNWKDAWNTVKSNFWGFSEDYKLKRQYRLDLEFNTNLTQQNLKRIIEEKEHEKKLALRKLEYDLTSKFNQELSNLENKYKSK
jgi:hypothetical protein